jgi:hypothetical protein
MKKVVLTLVAIVVAAGAFAQISGGVKAGVNLANQKFKLGDESEAGDMKIGFLVGGYLVAPIGEKFSIQPELFYSAVGSEEDGGKLNFSYLSVPVMFRYNFNEMINLHLGPQLGLLLSAKAKEDGGDDVDIKDSFKGMDFGGAVGIGFDFGSFNAGLRYYQGFSNILDVEDVDSDDVKMTNSSFQIAVGYRLFGGE